MELIFSVWAGVSLILFGLGYAWITKLETLATYTFIPLAVVVLFRGIQQYWHFRSTAYGANYRNEAAAALIFLVALAFYRRRRKQDGDGDSKWRRR